MTKQSLRNGPLPLTFDEITPEWLTRALCDEFEGVEVATAVRSGERFGTSSSARLDITYVDRAGHDDLPTALYVKGGFNPLTRRRTWGDFAAVDEENRQGIVVLEDMSDRGVGFGSYLEPPPPTGRIAAALEQLAAHHARWWQDPGLVRYAGWGDVQREYLRYLIRPKHWEHLKTRDYGASHAVACPVPQFVLHRRRGEFLAVLGRRIPVHVQDGDAGAELGQPQRAGPPDAPRSSPYHSDRPGQDL